MVSLIIPKSETSGIHPHPQRFFDKTDISCKTSKPLTMGRKEEGERKEKGEEGKREERTGEERGGKESGREGKGRKGKGREDKSKILIMMSTSSNYVCPSILHGHDTALHL